VPSSPRGARSNPPRPARVRSLSGRVGFPSLFLLEATTAETPRPGTGRIPRCLCLPAGRERHFHRASRAVPANALPRVCSLGCHKLHRPSGVSAVLLTQTLQVDLALRLAKRLQILRPLTVCCLIRPTAALAGPGPLLRSALVRGRLLAAAAAWGNVPWTWALRPGSCPRAGQPCGSRYRTEANDRDCPFGACGFTGH